MKTWDIKYDPRDLGYFMPGEWAEHECCWMAWPSRTGLWSENEKTMQEYADVANAIAKFELVKMLVPPERIDDAAKLLNKSIKIFEFDTILHSTFHSIKPALICK